MIPSPDILKAVVCNMTGLTQHEFNFSNQRSETVLTRKLFVLLAMDVCQYRECEVTRYMGHDHSTTSHHLNSAKDLLDVDKRFANIYHRIRQAITTRSELDDMPRDALILKLKITRIDLDNKINEIDQIIETLTSHEYTNQQIS